MTRADNPALVSCIIPVFNGEKYLQEAIESVLRQTYAPIEIIVVDDGSADGTGAVADRYSDRIRYLRQNNMGPAAARNSGIRSAGGQYIAFLDADDLWHPEKIRLQVQQIEREPGIDGCFTLVRDFWAESREEEISALKRRGFIPFILPFVPSSFFCRASLFSSIGYFNPALHMGEDGELFNRFRNHGAEFDVLSQVLAFHRLHETNLSRGRLILRKEEILEDLKASIKSRRRNEKEASGSKNDHDIRSRSGASPESRLFDEMLDRYRESASHGGEIIRRFRIGSRNIEIRFADATLLSRLTAALNHIRTLNNLVHVSDLTISVWDGSAAGRSRHLPDWEDEVFSRNTTECRYSERPPYRMYFLHNHGIFQAYDASRQLALFCIRDQTQIPQWECGSPLRQIIGWWSPGQGMQLLHGAVIGTEKEGVLLCGRGGSGKSTVALSCLAAGMAYVSDDYCLVTTDSPYEAIALYNSGKLLSNAGELIPALAPAADIRGAADEAKTLFFFHPGFSLQLPRRLRIRALFIAKIDECPGTAVERASKSEGLKALAPSTLFQMSGSRSEHFHEIERLVKALPCYTLRIGSDLTGIPAVILEFLTRAL